MKRLFYSFTFILFFNAVSGQIDTTIKSQTLPVRVIKTDSIKLFVESLSLSILRDTIKFNDHDLININGYTKNTKPYSTLIIIDFRFSYRLDIINGTMVSAFVKEALNPSIIDAIYVFPDPESVEAFGPQGKNGCIIILLKPKSKFNYRVGGLEYNKKRKKGNNFNQRKEGQIMLRT